MKSKESMKSKMKGLGLALIALVLVSTAGVIAPASDIEINIETHLPETELIADGTTVYELEVRADTTSLPSTEFLGVEWDIVVPSYITILNGALPDGTNNNQGPSTEPTDFFYDILEFPLFF